VIVSPTYVPDLVNACLDLLIDGERGIWHLANVGRISWSELAKEVASLAALDSQKLVPRPLEQLHLRAARPLFSVLSSERAILMPSFEDALSRYFQDCEVDWRVREQRPQQLTA
jgi:dTDP-4-dehydrorhamnose reductase